MRFDLRAMARTMGRRKILAALAAGLALAVVYLAFFASPAPHQAEIMTTYPPELTQGPPKHVVLLGASIGKAWHIAALPQRSGIGRFSFEYKHGSPFDKSEELRSILGRTKNKPDLIFLKECAAYFPGDLAIYQALMIQWIGECRAAGVEPIPATVVPVTPLQAYKQFAVDIVKLRNPFRRGLPFAQKRLKSLLAYNDWLREYAAANGIAVLDLEAATRRSARSRYLRSGLARIDGLHLKPAAYPRLDSVVWPALAEALHVGDAAESRPAGDRR